MSRLRSESIVDETASLLSRLGAAIGDSGLTIAIAESCTGGLLSGTIAADPGVSSAFDRGFVVYSPDAKCDLLGLDRQEVEACQGVSKRVAIDMVQAALAQSTAALAVATTGFAGPREGEEEVGLVHLAVVRRGGDVRHREKHFGDIGRKAVCDRTIAIALHMLTEAVESDRDKG